LKKSSLFVSLYADLLHQTPNFYSAFYINIMLADNFRRDEEKDKKSISLIELFYQGEI